MNRPVAYDLIPDVSQPAGAIHASAAPVSHHLLGVVEDLLVCLSLVGMILLGLVVADVAFGGAEVSAPVVAEVAAPGR
ncbi:MAG: hypothetical protein ACKOWF_01825 [Chloroflexota bacterium]